MIETGAVIVGVMRLRFVWAHLLNCFDDGANADESRIIHLHLSVNN